MLKKLMSNCVITFLLLLSSCTQKVIKDDFNHEQVEKYKTDLFSKYPNYTISDNIKKKADDFISSYATCGFNKDEEALDYDIIQSYQLYTLKDSIVDSIFDYEVVHFPNAAHLDSTIQKIKENNCIDETTQKIHRIYIVGRNTIIGVNYSNFDITDFENFLFKEFNKSVTIELINISG